ncbi:MAG: KH domain-containing protein [Chloroflexota bacterium]|nr:KH domain-containing protein [Chloroflexota bacterium]
MANERDEILTDQHDEDDGLTDVEAEAVASASASAENQDSLEEASVEATESLRELVTYLVNSLVDEPESVEIEVIRRGPSVHIQLCLPESELGKVIGRGGRIAKAIRTVLLIAGSKHHLRVSLDIEG